jgi:taurine dioxygenase
MGEYETIAVEPLTATIGARIDGVDLTRSLSPAVTAEIREALLRHLVVFFRGQDLSADEHLAFASQFGPPVSASIGEDERDDEVFVVLEDTADSPPKADRWHTDVPFVAEPPNLAVLCMVAAPSVGGDTLWASLYAAYDSLSPAMQAAIADLEIDLGLGASAETIRELYGDEYHRRVVAEFRSVRHPLVRVHPETGRAALYLCGSFMQGVAGMTTEESELLLGFLASRLDDPNLQCRWRWQQHDVVMWDERCTNHRAVSDHYPDYRMVRRVLAGCGRPIPVSGA